MVQKKDYQIFQGSKAARINKFVLMVLFENGCLSAFKIAKKVAKLDPQRVKKNPYHEAQKINSVLTRKNGRLPDLLHKGFIEKCEGGYKLTFLKGFCTALTLYKRIEKPAINPFSEDNKIFPEFAKAFEIVAQANPEARLEEEEYELMASFTKKILERGLNFELLSNTDFNTFFQNEWQIAALQGLDSNAGEKKLEIPDEAKELLADGAIRLENVLREKMTKQLKELESVVERYVRSIKPIEEKSHNKK